MKRFFAVSAVLITLTSLASAADKQLLGLMMPDAKVVAGMSMASFRGSPFGQFLLSQVQTGDPNFLKFTQATGFDPTRDIDEVVAAAPALHDPNGLVALRGKFDINQILAFAKLTGVQVDTSQGVPIIPSPDGKGSAALLDGTLAVIGDSKSVMDAVARRAIPTTLDPGLTAKVNALSGTQDVWAVSNLSAEGMGVPPATNKPAAPGEFNFAAVQSIQQSSAGVKFGTSVSISVEAVTDTAENANALAGLVRMMVGLAQMSQSNPQVAQAAALLQNLTIQTNGPALQLLLSVPEDVIEKMTPPKGHAVKKVADVR
jgi:hypothetical protein